jgi:hypothetical protein
MHVGEADAKTVTKTSLKKQTYINIGPRTWIKEFSIQHL